MKQTLKALNLAADDYDKMVAGRDPLKVMCNRISRFKDSLILPQEAETRVEAMILEANRTGVPTDAPGLRASAQAYLEYQRRLREANSADFGDLLLWPTRAMQSGDDYRQQWVNHFDAVFAMNIKT